MSDLLALDPSINSPGIAIFRDRVLFFAGKVKLPRGLEATCTSIGERWFKVADAIAQQALAQVNHIPFDAFIFERPQIYRGDRSKGDPNDLVGLAAIGAGVAMRIRPSKFWSPTPADWTGQIQKRTSGSAKDSPRALRIMSRLDEVELERVPNQHDAIDAVGLGLWALGRLTIARVYQSSL